MKKRILSCFMALALCLTLLPATALAEETEHAPHCLCGKAHTSIGDHTKESQITFDQWLASDYEGSGLVLRAYASNNTGGTLVQSDSRGLLLPAGAYYLQGEVTIDKPIVIQGNVTICLNGKTLQSKCEDAGPVFLIEGTGELTLTNCNGTGKVTCASYRDGRGSGVQVNSGTFNLYGGTITGNKATKGGGVYVDGRNSKFNMYGGTISGNEATKGGGGGVYVSGGTFTMNGNASVTSNKATDQNNGTGGGVYVSNNGTFTMNGGSITKNTANSTDGGVGVYRGENPATFTMNGGTITGNKATNRGGGVGVYGKDSAFIMNGGTITGNKATKGGGVYVDNKGVRMTDATFTMNNNASVKGNTANQGGGVYVESGKFDMNDGTITGNTATNTDQKNDTYGGGVYVNKSGTFEMNGSASVSGNTADTYGGGVGVYGGKFNMNDGTISGNTAPNGGGGVYASSGQFNMNDGTISGNKANANGGGVFVHTSATFTVSLAPTVTGNTITTNRADSNVHLMVSAYITIGNRGLNDSASIGVTKTVDGGVFAKGSKNLTPEDAAKFKSDEIGYEVSVDTNKTQLVLKMKKTPPPDHRHEWSYQKVNDATIKATCKGTGDCEYKTKPASVKISMTKTTYPYSENMEAPKATLTHSANWPKDLAKAQESDITYWEYVASGDSTEISGAPTKVGKYKASITVENQTASVEYEITKGTTGNIPVTKITLSPASQTLKVGQTQAMTVVIEPQTATNRNVTWKSSEPDVATVDTKGTVTAKAPGKAKITATAADGNGASASCEITVTGGTTPSQPGGSSSGGSGSYDSNPIIKTETKNNPDGSTTKTETRKDGTVTQTTTGKDGSVSKTETKKDGSSVTENKAADGSTGTVKTGKNGQTEANAKVSNKAIENAKKNGKAVKAPVEVKAARNSSVAPTVKVELPQNSGKTEVEIPVSNANAGTVAVLVHPDGTEEILKDSIPTEDGIRLTVDGSATVKIVDNAKNFIDTQNHWAKDEIDFVSARELVNGMSATRYAPDATATRAQLWTILARQNDADLSGGANWYEKAQLWSKDKGISDGTNPSATITRAQMVTMLWRTMGQPAAADKVSFADVPAGSYYAQAVAWAVEGGITQGVGGGRFDPNATCTRAQIAAFLARSMK